jgi:Mce-associated membrane protein
MSDDELPAGEGASVAAPPKSRLFVLGGAAFALAALIAAAIFGVQWWVASNDDNAALAKSRDDVIRVGGQAVKAYTEVDYEKLDDYFNRQRALSDKTMNDQLSQSEPTFRKALAEAKSKVVTTIQDIAVEELDDHEGKASFLAAIDTEVTQPAGTAHKPLRLEVSMTRDGQDWKVSGIGNVPLVAAGQ